MAYAATGRSRVIRRVQGEGGCFIGGFPRGHHLLHCSAGVTAVYYWLIIRSIKDQKYRFVRGSHWRTFAPCVEAPV